MTETIKSPKTKSKRAAVVEPTPVKAPAKRVASRRKARTAKFAVGSIVRHKFYPFRGVVFDIDPVFDNTEEWWLSIPSDVRPRKDQPFYHLLAENADTEYIAYVSEQNLLADKTGEPVRHPKIAELFEQSADGTFKPTYYQPH